MQMSEKQKVIDLLKQGSFKLEDIFTRTKIKKKHILVYLSKIRDEPGFTKSGTRKHFVYSIATSGGEATQQQPAQADAQAA